LRPERPKTSTTRARESHTVVSQRAITWRLSEPSAPVVSARVGGVSGSRTLTSWRATAVVPCRRAVRVKTVVWSGVNRAESVERTSPVPGRGGSAASVALPFTDQVRSVELPGQRRRGTAWYETTCGEHASGTASRTAPHRTLATYW